MDQTNEQSAVPEMVGEIETKTYEDGTTATGPGPLPDESPSEPTTEPTSTEPSHDPAPPSAEALKELLAAEVASGHRLHRLEAARALRKYVDGDPLLGEYTKPDDECIESFIDTDDRVMRVVVTPTGLAKVEMHHG